MLLHDPIHMVLSGAEYDETHHVCAFATLEVCSNDNEAQCIRDAAMKGTGDIAVCVVWDCLAGVFVPSGELLSTRHVRNILTDPECYDLLCSQLEGALICRLQALDRAYTVS